MSGFSSLPRVFLVRHLLLIVVALFGLGLACRAAVLVDTDFGRDLAPITEVEEPARSIRGVLPAPWRDDSGFNKEVQVVYSAEEEAGVRYLRIRRGAPGHVQIRFDPDLPQTDVALYRLTVRARTPDSRNLHAILIVPGEKSPWRSDVNLYAEWNTTVFEFLAPGFAGKKPYFQLQLPGARPGTVDLQSVRLERVEREAIVAALKAEFPRGGDPGNRAVNTRFPLGRPPAWVLDRGLDDAETDLFADPAESGGPSGLPALKFGPKSKGRLFSAPLPVRWSFDRHVASLYVKAFAPGRLLVLKGGDPRNSANVLAEQAFAAAPGWRRIELPFTPQLRGRVHLLAVEAEGPVWLDALQLERGESAGPWRAPVAELALALPDSDASVAGVQFLDEPARLRVAVMGPLTAGASLRARVTDLYESSRELPLVALPAGERLSFLDLDLAPALDARRPAGLLRVEARVADRSGREIGEPLELVFARLPRPRHWGKDAPDSPFGIHVAPVRRDLVLAKATGHNWARLHDTGNNITSWYYLEPRRGEWTWRDESLKKYRAQNLLVLGMLSTSPGWANGSPGTRFWDHAYIHPHDLDAWENYVRVVTTRYADQVAAWEVWNEPWLTNFWRRWDAERAKEFPRGVRDPLPTVAAAYTDLTRRAVRVAAETVPGKRVFGFNATGDHEGLKWVEALVAAGALEAPAPSGFSYHSYVSSPSGHPGDAAFTNGLPLVSGPLRAERADGTLGLPAWMTEGGSNRDSTRDGFWKRALGYENQDDWRLAAREEARYRLSTLAAGADKQFLYAMLGFDLFNGGGANASFMEVKGNGAAPHPTAVADAALAWQLEGLRFARQVDLAEGVFAWIFAGAGRSVAVVTTAPVFSPWSLPALPAGWEARDLWGNAALSPFAASADLLYLGAALSPEDMAAALASFASAGRADPVSR